MNKIDFEENVPMPGRVLPGRPAEYNFNEMKLGHSWPLNTMTEVKKYMSAFGSQVYEPAQKLGKLHYRNMEKHGGQGYRIWFLPHKEKESN